ncbi:iron donor protein CyaY [Gilliamella apicola]|uniref:Iron-sulfur cluster assembly protein CyaY n=1 Tax=Gilliamella apicola TaxID=1196095 RepID=A0A556SB61_9GAMM|nr:MULTISPECIES: iron donor protein CyaY [Gilliamella]KES19921.1 Protein implicated in iron transport [Gilliamella apicola SCGC AB-598-B02]MBI0095531.1 iron donor protein CyaY [Gilliamella sp. W8136]MCT6867749.1 iron donor protein CyaY [Gilliamella apicola]OTQ01796.1 iron donor protein CyaY [Gilliamella apicola]OTQ21924.1 iron donor protein CyaY [Gilliamella apicola]
MNITEFHAITDQLFNKIELFLDHFAEEQDIDIDYEINGNVITITFPNYSKIIVNTQEPLFQVWLATEKQGYHFDYSENDWVCTRTKQSFDQIFSQSVTDQATI